ncbi:bifunctional lysylphosphatidylglycerol synthetase/lysine--tRNA ligase LysX [Mycolicibacillus trivialis]|uniref:Lysine--tRNA ligase n=1 Tax=Mycolicibacillus trivialis TaxID=1798 RepID=A0A1X2EPW7_9MYCO|nr:bifunctional lysylphosphatidylglycerol synthetase/lysine--tRNA ligase LysX [Mycolicibacillus trivialis]ORX08119.1 lysine--tRNA ligase [Mycolicibacillus trivialis]
MTVTAPRRLHQPAGRFARVPTVAGWVIGVIATLSLLASVSPLVRWVIEVPRAFVNDFLFNFPDTSFAWSFVLALLAGALAARKRIAWWVLTLYLVCATVWNVHDLIWRDTTWPRYLGDGLGVAVHLAALAVLVAAYGQFWAKVRRGALLKAAAVVVAGLAIGTAVTWGLLELYPDTLVPEHRLLYALNRVSGFSVAPAHVFTGHPHVVLNAAAGLFGALALIAAAIVLFQSQRAGNALTADDETAIRGLLERYGKNDSLGYFATRRDKAVVFAPSGRAAITYRVEVGVCLASGDPVGDPRAWPQAIAAWLQLCRAYGWAPGVMGAGAAGAHAYRDAGLSALELGDEAILHTADFRLSGADMRGVRQAVTRARRGGLSVRIRRHHELAPAEMADVIARADRWRDTDTERGFSMALGRLGDPADGDCLLVEAVNRDGTVAALLSLVPWGTTGVSLDVMRRSPHSPNGTIELMVSELALRGGEIGVARISLNFAMFRAAFEQGAQLGAGPVARLWRGLLRFFSRWWQLETLYRSNMKYLPQWVPRYACYADARMIPRVGVASVIAEGFLVLPFSRRNRHTGQHTSAPAQTVAAGRDEPPGGDEQIDAPNRLPEQVRVRLAKLAALRTAQIDPYPVGSPPSTTVAAALADDDGRTVTVSGRVLRMRDHGGVLFAQLRDWSGEIQLLLAADRLSRDRIAEFSTTVDLGDLIEVSGAPGFSRNGTRSLLTTGWRLLGKCLHPLPDKWQGLTDPEARVRQRYLDLATNTDSRALITARSQVLRAIRDTLYAKGFLEVETPILQQVHGGANARPFVTHINAYNLDLYLRIAPELYLKRLCVGGVERVFELGRAFRNEGVDFSHNPEFTLLEAYQAHADYRTWIDGARELIQNAARATHGECVVLRAGPGGPEPVDIGGDWPVRTVHDAVSAALGEAIDPETPLAVLRRLCDAAGIGYQRHWDAGAVVLELYEHLVEARTEAPTFYTDFPTSVSPLTRPHRSRPGVAERWDLVAWGVELGTAYSELTDPVEQRRRLQRQSLLAAGGDPEAMELDEDFLQAMEYAMPPTGGLGMGVDRVVMLITGRSIRETLPFPLAKPR